MINEKRKMEEQVYPKILEEYYDALRRGDMEVFWNLQTDDIFYNWSGHSPISGRLQGKENMRREILPHVINALDMSRFEFAKKWKIVCAGGARVVVFMEADGYGVNGVRYDQRYVHMFEFRDNKICEFWEFFDTELAAAVIFTPQANITKSALLTNFEI